MAQSHFDLLCVKRKHKCYHFARNECLQKWQENDQLEHTKMIQQVQQSSPSRDLQVSATEDSLLMTLGKFLIGSESDLEIVSKTQWPSLSERKSCVLL